MNFNKAALQIILFILQYISEQTIVSKLIYFNLIVNGLKFNILSRKA